MEVTLTPDQEAFVRDAIVEGRYTRAEDAVQEALALWEERERKRLRLVADLEAAQASLARGEGRVLDEKSIRELAQEVRERGLARLAAEKKL